MPTPMRLTYSDLTAEQNAPYNLANYGQDYNSRLANEQYAQMVAGMGLRGQDVAERQGMLNFDRSQWQNAMAREKKQKKRDKYANAYGGIAQFLAGLVLDKFIPGSSPFIGQAVNKMTGGSGMDPAVAGAAGLGSSYAAGARQEARWKSLINEYEKGRPAPTMSQPVYDQVPTFPTYRRY